jgi:hypothetical protein
MPFPYISRTAFTLSIILTSSLYGQPLPVIDPSFSLSLSGNHGKGTGYRYLLQNAGDSGVIIVNECKRPVGWKDFRRIRHSIVNYALELTETAYGAPLDSADFRGELVLSAFDRNTIIRLRTAVTVGTLENGPLAGLLRLLMKQAFRRFIPPNRSKEERAPTSCLNRKDLCEA